MKNTSLWLVILSLLIVSCTNDSIDDTERIESKVGNKKSGKLTRTMQNLSPENSIMTFQTHFGDKIETEIYQMAKSRNAELEKEQNQEQKKQQNRGFSR